MCGPINHGNESDIASWCLSLPSIYEDTFTCNLINQVATLAPPSDLCEEGGKEGREGGKEGREGGKEERGG